MINEDLHKAWLHFKGKAEVWEFEPDESGKFCHETKYKHNYYIFQSSHLIKPFWIGRKIGRDWVDVTRKLRAIKIEFGNGGEYVFPK